MGGNSGYFQEILSSKSGETVFVNKHIMFSDVCPGCGSEIRCRPNWKRHRKKCVRFLEDKQLNPGSVFSWTWLTKEDFHSKFCIHFFCNCIKSFLSVTQSID
jgi:hypothetical protein